MIANNRQEIVVSLAESEQKLLQFLLRRFNLPKPLLHRWIRKGKVRCNGLKIKAFHRINEGDIILVPAHTISDPSLQMNISNQAIINESTKNYANTKHAIYNAQHAPYNAHNYSNAMPQLCLDNHLDKDLQIVYEDSELLVCNKPFGLPTHLGSKHTNSLISIVHRLYSQNIFKPTPVHRLDKDTSGLLLIALSYKTLRNLQEAFKCHEVVKEYFAWIEGRWPYDDVIQLEHKLEKKYTKTFEKVQAGTGKNCICIIKALHRYSDKTLLQIRLITGRTHQIRAQLASLGFPLYGDVKYGSTIKLDFKLHAFRLMVPDFKQFELLPSWTNGFDITTLPRPFSKNDINSKYNA